MGKMNQKANENQMLMMFDEFFEVESCSCYIMALKI
jgi:hypothetical protein